MSDDLSFGPAGGGNQATICPGTAHPGSPIAPRCSDAKEAVTAIARQLGIGRSTLYRTLAAYGEAAVTRSEARS
ncbi:helix-turn-helix domain-containing protein [Streptomyces sp. NPDC050448]|uniref:helix-turn-helix domain-containing protein n=1 Tax=Streptomyces sp. NPDC050448 TaxID=3155404 RepID=UPI00344793BF